MQDIIENEMHIIALERIENRHCEKQRSSRETKRIINNLEEHIKEINEWNALSDSTKRMLSTMYAFIPPQDLDPISCLIIVILSPIIILIAIISACICAYNTKWKPLWDIDLDTFERLDELKNELEESEKQFDELDAQLDSLKNKK